MTGPRTSPQTRADLRRYRPLLEALRAMATAPSLEASAPVLLQALGVGLDWTLASLLIVDQEAVRLRVIDLWSPDPEHAAFVDASRQISFGPGEGLPGRSWLEDRSIWLEDVREEPGYLRQAVARDAGLVTGVWVPLRAQGALVGILELYSAEQRPVDEALMIHLEDFGAILGMALQRLRDTALLVEREERIRSTIDGALDAVISIDARGLVTEWNPQAESLFGWPADEVRGRHLGDLIVPERLRDAHRAGMARLISTGQPRIIGRRLEMPAIDRNGREFAIELTVSAHHTGGRPSFSAFLRDLTGQKAAEERIAVLARLTEENPHPVIRVGSDGALLYANRPGRKLVRQAPGRPVGRWLRDAVFDALKRSVEVEIDHASRWSVHTVRVVPIPERGYANVYALDITRRVRAVEALREREAAVRDLYLVTSAPGRSISVKIEALLRLVRERFGIGTAVFARVAPSGLIAVEADAWDGRVERGVEFPLAETFGRSVVQSGDLVTILDAAVDTGLSSEPAHTIHGLRSYLGAPVTVGDTLYGVLSFSSPRARRDPFPSADVEYLRLIALWVGAEIEREGAREEIAAANIELVNAAAQARALASEAEAANRTKDDFLATVSHEIRTPLSGLLGMVELLKGTRLAVDEQHYLEVMQSSGEALLSIINEILDFSKIEAGQLDLRATQFNPEDVVVEVAALHRPTARSKGLSLRTIVDPAVPSQVLGDAGRVGQALGNLVTNAIKFTETGSITVRLSSPRERWIELGVTDSGIGIAERDQRRLFEPFVQLDSSQARRFGGTGLGLAITRRVVERMGGTIGVSSTLGRGSTFTVRLPVDPPVLPRTADGQLAEPADSAPVRRRRRRVLVVDDHPVNLEVATTIIAQMGHRPVAASQGDAALRELERGRIDLVLLDCQLPGMDGFEVARRVRELERARRRRRVPIVAVTANATKEGRSRALESGMDDYLAKPYRARALEGTVDRWLAEPNTPSAGRAPEGAKWPADLPGSATRGAAAGRPTSPRVARAAPASLAGAGAPNAPGLLGELAEFADAEAIRDLVELFIQTGHEAVGRIHRAADTGDRDVLAAEAHALRGAAGTIGADDLAAECTSLERLAATGAGRLPRDVAVPVLAALATELTKLERWHAAGARASGMGQQSTSGTAVP